MPTGSERKRTRYSVLKGDTDMDGRQVVERAWPVVAGMPAIAVVLMGAQCVFQERHGLPSERYKASQCLRAVGL